ncbi:type III secretion system export apparatus subunit SctT [uncultured Methylobacterium sp.]|uniref:type III secretion system export apparatus subunit SctT n=1 Tax=uncultured Methylobacterium sp. TaxID=157278 RepID=UPI002593C82B|nr:type III secretion system export apparatus subunit SctT [uncultured Methylobacterium sp.]
MASATDPATLAGLTALFTEGMRWVTAASLGMARPAGIFLILPVFTRAKMGTLIRLGLAFGLAFPVLGYSQQSLAPNGADVQVVRLVLVALKELFVGVLIGFVVGIPFWAIQSVGELIDTQRGISNEVAPVDPTTKSQASALGLFLGLLGITIFVAADGLNTLVETLYGSYGLWPIQRFLPAADLDAMMGLARLVDRVLRTAMLVGGPVIVLMLLLDLCVMLIGRFAPQLNANDLAPTVKNVAVVLFMMAYAGYLFDYAGAEIGTIRSVDGVIGPFLR